MIYELITPHDPYTYTAEDDIQAAMVCILLGAGMYGAHRQGNDNVCSVMIGPNSSEWIKETYNEDVEILMDKELKKQSFIASLKSVAVCTTSERTLLEDVLKNMSDENEKMEYIEKWHNKKRTSLTNLRKNALLYAFRIEKMQKEKQL